MNAQIITTPSGERMVMLPEAEFKALLAAAEDAADRAAVADFRRKIETGDEELLPAGMVDRLIAGENRIKVWRQHRGLTSRDLAEKAGIGQPYLSQIEGGKREGKVETLRKIAAALNLSLEELVG